MINFTTFSFLLPYFLCLFSIVVLLNPFLVHSIPFSATCSAQSSTDIQQIHSLPFIISGHNPGNNTELSAAHLFERKTPSPCCQKKHQPLNMNVKRLKKMDVRSQKLTLHQGSSSQDLKVGGGAINPTIAIFIYTCIWPQSLLR